jgi:hypothetical protein
MTMNKSDPTKGMLHPDIENMTEARKSDAQKLTELLGGCWHENTERDPLYKNNKLLCTKCNTWQLTDPCIRRGFIRPTYTHADEVLIPMREKLGEDKYMQFVIFLISSKEINYFTFIENYILNAPALLDKAIEYLEKKKGE